MTDQDNAGASPDGDRAVVNGAGQAVSAVPASVPSAWEWWAGPDDEFYRCGPCATREEAIEEGLNNYDDRYIHIIEAIPQQWPAPDASSIIDTMFDTMFENSDDLFGEDYPEPIGSKEEMAEAEADLQAALNGWMERWRGTIFPKPTTFGSTRNREIIRPPFVEAMETIAAIAQATASAMSAGTAETAEQAQGEARQRDGDSRDAKPQESSQ